MKSTSSWSSSFAIYFGAFVLGCSGADAEEGEPIGIATLEVKTIPPGAQCLQLIGTGSSSFSVTTALIPGSTPPSITIGRLPLGASTVNANVYDVACASIAGVAASWIADPQSVTFRAGVATSLVLNLRPNNPVTVSTNFVGTVVSMTAGYATTGLVLSDGTTRTTGTWSPLGTGKIFANTSSLVGIHELDAPRFANAHGCARTLSLVNCWGQNPHGQLGAGVPVGTASSIPVTVTGIALAEELVVGARHSCGRRNGSILCWGFNGSGELGNGTTTNSATPVTVASLGDAPDMMAAGHAFTCANTAQGVACWGLNSSGQLGDGTLVNRPTATNNGLRATVSLAAGFHHACAVRGDGTVRCWGNNLQGQLGDGTSTQRSSPVQVQGISDAVEVVAGANHTCVRRQGGTVSCWGYNVQGQLGDGTAMTRLTAANVPGLSGAAALAAGYAHTCALLENRTVTCWGEDLEGQAGDGVLGMNYEPTAAIVQ